MWTRSPTACARRWWRVAACLRCRRPWGRGPASPEAFVGSASGGRLTPGDGRVGKPLSLPVRRRASVVGRRFDLARDRVPQHCGEAAGLEPAVAPGDQDDETFGPLRNRDEVVLHAQVVPGEVAAGAGI